MNNTRIYRPNGGRRGRLWLKILGILIALGLLAFAVLEGIVLANAKTEIRATPDVMLVLGAQVKQDGPAVLLQDRIDTAAAYLNEHPDLPVIVSGGQGKDEPTTEAVAMRDGLMAQGVSGERIWLEERSHNTSQNLRYSMELLEEKGYDPADTHVLVVSNGFHLARVKLLSGRYGLDVSVLAAPSSHAASRLYSYLREAPGLVKSFLFD